MLLWLQSGLCGLCRLFKPQIIRIEATFNPHFITSFEIFLKNFNQGQYGLIHVVHLVNFDQSLLTLYVVWSMLNFAVFPANSNQETIWTIRFDPYFPHKVFITFHQRLMLFSILSAFKKLNQRWQNLSHIVLNIMIVFDRCCIFQCFWQILIKVQYGLTHFMF